MLNNINTGILSFPKIELPKIKLPRPLRGLVLAAFFATSCAGQPLPNVPSPVATPIPSPTPQSGCNWYSPELSKLDQSGLDQNKKKGAIHRVDKLPAKQDNLFPGDLTVMASVGLDGGVCVESLFLQATTPCINGKQWITSRSEDIDPSGKKVIEYPAEEFPC